MIHSKAAAFYILFQIATLFVNAYGQCPSPNHTLPSVVNGHRVNTTNLKLYSDGTAIGFYYIKCDPGFALDTDIGDRITCLDSGTWSQPLPKCTSMGSCRIADLFDFIQTAEGIKVDQSKSFVFTNGIDDKQALGGSNITLQCRDEYTNVGGSLTIVCTEANTWTTFPKCISTSTATTTTAPVRCPLTDDTLTFVNGYIASPNDLLLYSDNTAKGSAIVVCSSGYVVDSISQGQFSCNEGNWSPRPFCIKTARCSLMVLQNFVKNSSLNRGLVIVSQHVSTDANGDDEVLFGSYILFSCINGFTNNDGYLNVTCNKDSQWSHFPSCISPNGNQLSGQCPWESDALPSVLNGHKSNVDNLRAFSNGLASGYYDIECDPGFALDTDIGGQITCLDSGAWSQPLPKCTSMGSCPLSSLTEYIRTADGIQTDQSMSFVFTNGIDSNQALGGSNITIQCRNGYTNIGGALTIVCTSANTWTPFPQCVSQSSPTTQAMDSTVDPALLRCPFIEANLNFPYGHLVNTSSFLIYSDNTAEGFLAIACSPGYIIDSISQGVFSCNNGHWSSRPSCTTTARCSLPEIETFVGNPSVTEGLEIASQSISTNADETDVALIGSTISFLCKKGFSNTDGNLNVSCNDDGRWSTFPACIPDPTTPTPGGQ